MPKPAMRWKRLMIFLTWDDDQHYWIAKNTRIGAHGTGRTPTKAVDEFYSSVDDLYRELTSSESVLSGQLLDQFYFLRSVMYA